MASGIPTEGQTRLSPLTTQFFNSAEDIKVSLQKSKVPIAHTANKSSKVMLDAAKVVLDAAKICTKCAYFRDGRKPLLNSVS